MVWLVIILFLFRPVISSFLENCCQNPSSVTRKLLKYMVRNNEKEKIFGIFFSFCWSECRYWQLRVKEENCSNSSQRREALFISPSSSSKTLSPPLLNNVQISATSAYSPPPSSSRILLPNLRNSSKGIKMDRKTSREAAKAWKTRLLNRAFFMPDIGVRLELVHKFQT